MPSFSSKVDLSASAKSSNIVLADVDLIKGAFKVYTSSDLNSTNVNYFSDGQIVYVSDSGSLYKANVTLANPGLGIFSDSVSFSEFSFDSGSFTSASFNSGDSTLTFFGPNLSGSAQVSMSVDLSDLSGGGGGGATQDLQSVLTVGNKASGSVVLENDNSSGKLGLFFHADPSLSYNYTASISILNNGTLETGLGGIAYERITPNRGSNVLLQFTASNSVAFTGISNEEQSYVLGYDSVTGNVTYYNTSSFGGGSTDTGSLMTTGSVSGNILTFTKGDGTTFNLTVDTGSSGGGSGDITAVIAGDGLSGGASTGNATLTLDTGSAHFIAGVLKSGLFRLTGSVYSTANDVAITGSLDVNFVESTQEFRVSSQSVTQFSINNEGVAVLAPRSTVPTAVSGGMYFSTDGNFYFGIQQ